jgi:uncharacterized protein YbjT (DUF2867 family)
MTNEKQPILVFGATGRQGGSVAAALSNAGWRVRALVRDPASAKSVALGRAGIELVGGSLNDPDSLRSAMAGIHGVFSVLPGNLGEDEEVRFGTSIADIAVESGVRHLVYSSGASASERPTGIPRFDAKPRIEAHVRSLPLTSTIVRPMIFMDMLLRPGFGLEEDRFTFFLRPDQSMQLLAVEDIGKFVAAIFADRTRFGGQTLRIASDTVTGRDIADTLAEAAGRPIAYARFPDTLLKAKPELAQMAASLDHGPLSRHADMDVLRAIHPGVTSFRSWLAASGRQALHEALRPEQGARAEPINRDDG